MAVFYPPRAAGQKPRGCAQIMQPLPQERLHVQLLTCLPFHVVPDFTVATPRLRIPSRNASLMAWSNGFMPVLPLPILPIRKIGR